MFSLRNILYYILVLILSACFSLYANIRVCPKCGYEISDTATVCSHCNAELTPKTQLIESEKEDRALANDDKSAVIDLDIIDADIAEGKTFLHKGDALVALMFFRNASALDLLSGEKDSSTRSSSILSMIEKCRKRSAKVKIKCSDCDGTGHRYVTFHGLSGQATKRQISGVCKECNGTGYVLRQPTIDDLKIKIGQAERRYRGIQLGRKYVAVGRAWVPAGINENLSIRQTVLLKTALAAPCRECLGLGKAQCSKCKGLGRVKCTNSGCVNGYIKEKASGSLVKMDKTVVCPVCRGSGFVSCESCSGKGWLLCKKCNGTGERAVCSTCGGSGLIDCRKCSGTGSYKGVVCSSCKGEGVVQCKSCNGDGRKR